jgi:hypothetical protein
MSNVNTDGLRGVSNSHLHIEARLLGGTALTSCPLCYRPFTDEEQASEVHARHEAQERARAELFERQLEEREVRGRRTGAADAQEASKERIEALSGEIASLKDGAETTINERTEAAIAKERLKMQAENAARDAINAEEKDRWLKKLSEMQRVVDRHTANQLGDSAELDHLHLLQRAFPEDDFSRVGKGKEGGDILWIVRSRARECGRILIESKNTQRWSEDYSVKLRNDKIAAGVDYAICAACKLPLDTDQQLAIRENGEVFVCSHPRVLAIGGMLRITLIREAMRSDGRKDASEKNAKWYAFWMTGEGRNLLMSACDDINHLRKLDADHARQTKNNLAKRAEVYVAQAQKFADILATWDDIIRGDDDGETF